MLKYILIVFAVSVTVGVRAWNSDGSDIKVIGVRMKSNHNTNSEITEDVKFSYRNPNTNLKETKRVEVPYSSLIDFIEKKYQRKECSEYYVIANGNNRNITMMYSNFQDDENITHNIFDLMKDYLNYWYQIEFRKN